MFIKIFWNLFDQTLIKTNTSIQLELLSFKNEQNFFWNSRLTMIILWTTEIRKIEINFGKRVYCAADGDRTPAACVTGLYTYHYTTGPSY